MKGTSIVDSIGRALGCARRVARSPLGIRGQRPASRNSSAASPIRSSLDPAVRSIVVRVGVLLSVASLIGPLACAQDAKKQPTLRPADSRSKEGKLLNRWWEARRAAGNIGDWYDNRDRGHSKLNIGRYHPQMKQVSYTKEETARRLDWAAQTKLLPFVTLGNSSTSAPPERGGSNPRIYYVSPRGIAFLYGQYRTNNLYVYPEHRDYDPGRNRRTGYGDLYPTNTPYLVISQGSSGSDRAFLRAIAYTMAAFRPEVKQELVKRGLLMPTLQFIMRRCYKDVRSVEDYLSGKAHPPVFDGKKLDSLWMVHLAQDMTLDTIPALVQLDVVREDFTTEPVEGRSEVLADTPVVIARIHRAPDYKKHITVTAKRSRDVNDRKLEYKWVVLQGDADRIEIKLSDGGATAELTIPYHSRRPVRPGSKMESNRVDIGVFVHNGSSWSAPGFVTVFYLDNELRTYDRDGRPLDIYRAAGDTRIGYDVESASQLTGDRYDIFDWAALFEVVANEHGGLASELLRDHLSAEAIAATAEAAKQFTPERLAVLNAKSGLSKEQKTRRRKIEELLAEALTAERPGLGGSVKTVLERALNAIRADVNLYIGNKNRIDALADACKDKRGKSAFQAARKKPAAIGVLKNGKLQSTVPGAAALTRYEVYRIECLNLAVMNHLLYPTFLRRVVTRNYVDRRLAEPQPWRDVYRCDDTGKILGWTRYDDGQPGAYVLKERH